MANFRELVAWQAAHRLELRVYQLTASFPRSEVFGLAAQLRRGATSVSSNIAEGTGRGTDREFRRCVLIARASAHEVMSQLLTARDLGWIVVDDAQAALADAENVARMLTGLARAISKRVVKPEPDHPP